MAEITNVNPQDMLNTANSIKGNIDEWTQAVNSIFTLQGELDGMWDGDANDAFNAQWADDKKKYENLAQLMQKYCVAITNAANLYIEREAEVTQIINSK